MAENGKNKIACSKCDEEHNEKQCTCVELRCVNCTEATNKFKLNLGVSHDAFSRLCHVYKQMGKKREQRKFNIE